MNIQSVPSNAQDGCGVDDNPSNFSHSKANMPPHKLEATESEVSVRAKRTLSFYFAFFMLFLSLFMVALELVIVASALAAIAKDLNASSNDAYWCGTGYILAQTVSQPIYGSLSEIFGRKIMLQIAIMIFLLASILCSRAQDIYWLIATRVVS
jgi:predicted MFS family arabinose efflux permease